MLTVEDVNEMVELIRGKTEDNEMAHSDEDDLHITVLKAIADGECSDPVGCCKAALKTLEIEFERWCA